MGVLDRFEKGVERALSNTFARAFRADLKPVDIASALRTEMDDRTASLSRGRTVVPNNFVVELGPDDLEKVEEWGRDSLLADLTTTATSHAADQGYVFVGRVNVELQEIPDSRPGEFTIRSSSAHSAEVSAPPARESEWTDGPEPSDAVRPPRAQAHPVLDVNGQRYLLTGPVTVIGRGSEADIIVNDSGISRQHLEIRITDEGIIATDLRSTNGTFVEGHRVDAATLVDGNTLSIGRTRIIFWAADGTPPGASA